MNKEYEGYGTVTKAWFKLVILGCGTRFFCALTVLQQEGWLGAVIWSYTEQVHVCGRHAVDRRGDRCAEPTTCLTICICAYVKGFSSQD
jgi:hypothetical protein